MKFDDEDEINPFSRKHISRESTFGSDPEPPKPPTPVRQQTRPQQPSPGIPFLKLALGCAGLLLACTVICCGGVLFLGYSWMQEPVEAATKAVAADKAIAKKLGEPIERTSTHTVEVSQENNQGTANLGFNIKGPNGTAEVRGTMRIFADEWIPEDLTVTCADGTEFKLPAEANKP